MNKMMTKASLLAIAFIVLIPLGLQAQDEGFYPYSYARLSYVNGSVYVQRTSDLGYEKGEVNLALVQGDKMGTENGQAEIHFGRRNYLRLDDNTRVEFAILPSEGDERIKIHLTEGSAYFRVSYLALDKGVEVHTPDASFYVLEEGLYRFDVRLDRETRVFVREGSLEAAAEEGSVLVRSKETLTAADGRLLGDPEYYDSPEDSFDNWSGSRDALLSERSDRQYLPSELEEYEEELDQNGHWVYERPYGNVWVPNVYYDDWRPYSYGRWVWYPVIGWTWISSESWGWPVYHYGRWNWRFGLGWYWIPRQYWGPAWVHWWWDRDHIGWCPLTWYDRPGYLFNNRFYDRYDDRYFSAHNRAMTVVRRDHLQSPGIGRHQVGSSELDRIDRVSLRAEQPSVRPTVDNARPQAIAARRVLADRPGSRNGVKELAPSNSLSSSRLRQGAVASRARTRERDSSLTAADRGAVSRPTVRNSESAGRAIRSYPSQRLTGDRTESGAAANRRSVVASPSRRTAADSRDSTARVSPSQGQTSSAIRSGAAREPQRTRTNDSGSGNSIVRSGSTTPRTPATSGTVRSGSSRTSGASSGRSQSRTYSSSSSVSRPSSRLSAPSSSSPRSSSAIPRSSSSARSSSPSASRPSSSRATSTVQPRSSYSAPSRSSGSSVRSYSAPRSSSSSSGRSYSAPRPSSARSYSAPRSSGSSARSYSAPRATGSSSGRSYSAPRSSGSSSSSRSSSSGRSSSSSSRSSSSSSRSGSVKRKG